MSARRVGLRLGRRPSRSAGADASAPTVEQVLADRPLDATLAGAPALAARLVAAGHPARWTATPEVTAVDDETSRAAYRIMEASIDLICRFLPEGQNLTMRARIDGSDLVLSVQSSGLEGLGQQGLVPDADRAAVGALVTEARGRMTLRRTASGNWLGVVTLPL